MVGAGFARPYPVCLMFIVLKVRIKSDRQKNVAKLLADRRFRKMA